MAEKESLLNINRLIKEGSLDEAEQLIEKERASEEYKGKYREKLLGSYILLQFRREDYSDKTVSLIGELLDVNPESDFAHNYLIKLLIRTDLLPDAKIIYKNLQKINPDSLGTKLMGFHLDIAEIMANKERWDEKAEEQPLAHNKDAWNVIKNEIALNTERLHEISDSTKGMLCTANLPHHIRKELEHLQNDMRGRLALFENLDEKYLDGELYNKKETIKTLIKNGDYDGAKEFVGKSFEGGSGFNYNYQMAYINSRIPFSNTNDKIKLTDLSRLYLGKILDAGIDNKNQDALKFDITLALKSDKPTEARIKLEQVMKDPKLAEDKEFLNLYVETLFKQRTFPNSLIAHAEKLLEKDKYNKLALMTLAKIHPNDKAASLGFIEPAMTLYPQDVSVQSTGAGLYMIYCDFPKAHKTLDTILEKNPNVVSLWGQKINCHINEGTFEAAKKLLPKLNELKSNFVFKYKGILALALDRDVHASAKYFCASADKTGDKLSLIMLEQFAEMGVIEKSHYQNLLFKAMKSDGNTITKEFYETHTMQFNSPEEILFLPVRNNHKEAFDNRLDDLIKYVTSGSHQHSDESVNIYRKGYIYRGTDAVNNLAR